MKHLEAYAWFVDHGREPPAEIAPPVMLPGAAWMIDAFFALMGDRPVGFGAAPIPFSAIARYAAMYGLEGPDDFDPFNRLIQAMDCAWMEAVRTREG